MDWKAGQFTITVGVGDVPTPRPVAGWIRGLFALDFRVFIDEDDDYQKGWVLTHLPTGCVVSKLAMDLNEAIEVSNEIAACADWNFTDTKPDRAVGLAIKPIFERLGSKNMRGYSDIGPIWNERAVS